MKKISSKCRFIKVLFPIAICISKTKMHQILLYIKKYLFDIQNKEVLLIKLLDTSFTIHQLAKYSSIKYSVFYVIKGVVF